MSRPSSPTALEELQSARNFLSTLIDNTDVATVARALQTRDRRVCTLLLMDRVTRHQFQQRLRPIDTSLPEALRPDSRLGDGDHERAHLALDRARVQWLNALSNDEWESATLANSLIEHLETCTPEEIEALRDHPLMASAFADALSCSADALDRLNRVAPELRSALTTTTHETRSGTKSVLSRVSLGQLG